MFDFLPFSIPDVLIGFFLMNAMPHLIFATMQVNFISPCGSTTGGQLTWSAINVLLALTVFHFQYGFGTLLQNGVVIGALLVLGAFAVTGRFFYNVFN